MAKTGSKRGVVPESFNREIIKRFMDAKSFDQFVENYKGSRFIRTIKQADDIDKRIAKVFKEVGSITEAARIAKVSSYRVYSALSRVVYSA